MKTLRCFLLGVAHFFAALTLAHRAFCAAAIFLRAAALTCLVLSAVPVAALFVAPAFFPFSFVHRARCAAAILLLPATLMVLRPRCSETVLPKPLVVVVLLPRLPAPSRFSNARIALSSVSRSALRPAITCDMSKAILLVLS